MDTKGISFIVRVRNEEKTLESSIRSLFSLSIIHEIIIILHCCTDRSEEIARKLAEENANIKIYTYSTKVSRAGYETLATDKTSAHSFITYSNFCFDKGTMPWKFKWDADFIASPELINFLNSKDWVYENAVYYITYKMDTTMSAEIYLSCATICYIKYLFWESICYNANAKKYSLDDKYFIYHNSSLSDVKSYWIEEPWYITEDSEEARVVKQRIEQLTRDFGKEPIGMARALNAESGKINRDILNAKPSYVSFNE